MWAGILVYSFFGLSTWWATDYPLRAKDPSPVVNSASHSSIPSDIQRHTDEDPSLSKAVFLALKGHGTGLTRISFKEC